MIQYIFPNQLGKILLFVTSYKKCDVSKRQLILKSVTLYVKIRKITIKLHKCNNIFRKGLFGIFIVFSL
jgi:hypothetical protein